MKIEKSVIVVNYQSQEELKKCLLSIEEKEKEKENLEIVVVNNDIKPLQINKTFSFQLNVIEIGKNIGFGSACNLGVKKSRGEFLFFLNPDTTVEDNVIQKLVSFLKVNPTVGIVAPQLILAKNNLPQPWTSGKKTNLFSIVFKNTFNKPWKKTNITAVDWVSGAALMTRKSIFNKVGGFDENFFMYFEDQDFCLRVKKKGFQLLLVPFFKIIHQNGKSWKNYSEKKFFYYQSQLLFFKKNCPPWQFKTLKILHKIKFNKK